jgi:hypothetical protein
MVHSVASRGPYRRFALLVAFTNTFDASQSYSEGAFATDRPPTRVPGFILAARLPWPDLLSWQKLPPTFTVSGPR